jgi:hypothetical protein
MKIVHTFWTRNHNNLEKLQGQWLDLSFSLMSWCLSNLTLSRFYEVELLTDDFGQEVLVEMLGLKYKSTRLIFNDYEYPFDSKLWCFNKLYAYSLHQEPFLNVDGDVFIWKPFPEKLLEAPLIAQNLEMDLPAYVNCLRLMRKHFKVLPDLIPRRKGKKEVLLASNAGIFGGTNTQFFKMLYREAFDMLDQNRAYFEKVPIGSMNIMSEQYLFYLLAEKMNIPIHYLLSEVASHPNYLELQEFNELPQQCNYIHIMGAKRNPTVCEQMAARLYMESPELYHKCYDITRKLSKIQHYLPVSTQGDTPEQGYPASPESIKTYHSAEALPTATAFTVAHLFYRTLAVLKYLNLFNQVDISSFNALQESLSILLTKQDQKARIVADVFRFEFEKLQFIQSLVPQSETQEKKRVLLLQANQILLLDDAAFNQYQFEINPDFIRLKSEWCWTEANEFFSPNSNKALSKQLKAAPGYYETALYFYPQQQILIEKQLDGLNMLLLNSLERLAQNFTSLVEDINHQALAIQARQYQWIPASIIRSRLSAFLYEGLIVAKKMEQTQYAHQDQLIISNTSS